VNFECVKGKFPNQSLMQQNKFIKNISEAG